MNLHHLRAFLWLQWRLRVNQMQRGGLANKIILAIVSVAIVLAAIGLFAGFFGLAFLFAKASPTALLFTWDGLVLVFLAWWGGGLMVDLQRSEGLSLTKFLHLPVSLSGVFVLNYITSLFSLNLFLFVPTMVGFSLGLAFAIGPIMLLLLPLVAAFLLMVSALSYQFQGWLASLMVDKRRRRTVIFLATVVFILIFQLPNMINIYRPWEGKPDEIAEQINKEQTELTRAFNAKEITLQQFLKRQQDAQQARAKQVMEGDQQIWKQAKEYGWVVNLVLPPGWLPLGAMGLAEGNAIPALVGMIGMSLIGSAGLWRAYRTSVRLYTGQFTAGTQPAIVARPVEAIKEKGVRPPDGLIARKIPWLSEPASAIALACFRSLTRAPEARMLFLSPVFLVVIFGGMFWRGSLEMPASARPLMAYFAMATILLTLMQFVGNQFGFDRGGFRIFVLSPAPRRDILLGKNLAVLPAGLILVSPLLIVLQVIYPMRIDHLVALVPQFVSMYLLFCLLANFLSIYSPMAIAAGSLKPANTRFLPILMQLFFMSMFPLVLSPTLLPFGIEFGLDALEWVQGLPICLVLTVLECAVIVGFYRAVMTWQGSLLQAREQTILETVTTKAE